MKSSPIRVEADGSSAAVGSVGSAAKHFELAIDLLPQIEEVCAPDFVLIAEDMPDISSDATAVAFGDFRAGYTVAERPDLRVLRDPFSAKPHVLFYATKRVGGDVSDFAAIKLLRFSIT